ncbi:MAG: pseudouridine synthase [Anaerolineae bacterium]|nr:pseudouridine synthase [Anaerolineae bacterium]
MYRYVIAYKPFGVLSTRQRSSAGHENLIDMGVPDDLQSAGRLDLDSEGLLLLTNDGQTLHRLTHPDFSHSKIYNVLVLGRPGIEALTLLREGVEIKLGRTQPADVEILAGEPPLPRFPGPLPSPEKTSWLRIGLREGMNRQIKRMTAAAGHPTVRLVRVGIGRVALTPDLDPGQWRDLSAVERSVLLADVWPRCRRTRRHR